MTNGHDAPTAPTHVTSAVIGVAPQEAFAFLSDGHCVGRWALGSFDTKPLGGGVFVGHSLFDGKALYLRAEGDPSTLLVTYYVGPEPDRLTPRITAHVARSEAAKQCRVSLIAERTPEMTDERWRNLTVVHETEILLIKALLERPRE
jgi:hypothetical protein